MLQASGRMVQAVEKASHEDAQADGAEFDRPNPISSGSRRSSPERDPAPPCRSREGQDVATRKRLMFCPAAISSPSMLAFSNPLLLKPPHTIRSLTLRIPSQRLIVPS